MMKKVLFFIFLLTGCLGMAQTVERYVSTNGTHQGPFTSWITAATNIKMAVDWANTNNAGDTVWISNGVHTLPAEVIVSNVIVRGQNDQREAVIIDGLGTSGVLNRSCFRLNHPNAQLRSLTVSNGYSTSADYGGGVTVVTGQLNNVVIGWCYALYGGGGIYFKGPGLVTGCLVTANTGARGGGGIFMSSACTMSTVSCSQVIGNITTNTAVGYGGGGISVQKGTIESCLIASNQVVLIGGGGVCFYTGGGVLRDSTVIDNQTVGLVRGGGIGSSSPDTVEISGCLIRGNTAELGNGGGLYYSSVTSTCRVWNCTIESNQSPTRYGGGLYLSGVGAAISNAIMRGNWAANGSGAWLQEGATMRSCLIAGNTLGIGALYLQNTSTVENCTIVDNTAASAGGLRMAVTNAQMIRNCVIYDNWLTNGTRADLSLITDGANYFFNSCAGTTVLPPAQGNTTNNPLFIAADDYRLQKGSPCINTGTNMDWMTGVFDLDGRPRQDRFSGKVDMGAYEFVPEGLLFLGR